jgi:hypothetical protein
MNDVTIVSACDRNFLWGIYLLAVSAARSIPGVPLVALVTGFSAEDETYLTQFPGVTVRQLSEGNRRSVANRKAEALLTPIETDYVAWLDADCFVIGDIRPYLRPGNGELQIRMREPWENAWVWRDHYTAGETRGGLPKAVRERWQTDVAQRTEPRHDTTCVTNAFVLHRRYLPFIEQWQDQITKVIPPADTGVVDKSLFAYFMVDESVLSSLLAYSDLAPTVSDMMLNRDPKAHVAHFGANPKPWKRWRWSQWYCHQHVLDTLDWAEEHGYRVPPRPWSLKRGNTLPAALMAATEHLKLETRSWIGKMRRRLLPARN